MIFSLSFSRNVRIPCAEECELAGSRGHCVLGRKQLIDLAELTDIGQAQI
jgi:hypothetical protein